MKKYFFNEDGTIKVINMIILISIVFVVAIIFIYNKFLKREFEDVNEPVRTSEVTSSIATCKDCDFYFTLDTLKFNTYSEYNIANYIEVKNMALNNIKFSDYDNTLISLESKQSGLFIKVKDKVGKTKLVASYADITREIEIEISFDEIKNVDLLDHAYYISNGKETDLEIITDPKGIPVTDFNIVVEDTSIASLNEGKLIGLSEGKTKIILNYLDKVITQDLYVYDDLIHVESLNKNKKLEDVYSIDLSEFKDNIYNIVVTLDDRNNKGYSSSDLIITHEDENLEVFVDYDGRNSLDGSSYKYRITINGTTGSSIIKFSLGNTVRYLSIG